MAQVPRFRVCNLRAWTEFWFTRECWLFIPFGKQASRESTSTPCSAEAAGGSSHRFWRQPGLTGALVQPCSGTAFGVLWEEGIKSSPQLRGMLSTLGACTCLAQKGGQKPVPSFPEHRAMSLLTTVSVRLQKLPKWLLKKKPRLLSYTDDLFLDVLNSSVRQCSSLIWWGNKKLTGGSVKGVLHHLQPRLLSVPQEDP